jgi:predicted transcriptional regulator of viral defense system
MEREDATPGPSWDRLFETASAQEGYFTTSQAAAAGYSSQLLVKHLRAGRVARVRRGIYRIVHFPAGEHEELVVAWLWSEQAGVVSHQTALALHELSDALPARVHLSIPSAWRQRRLLVPTGISIHHADVAPEERTWFGAVPTTNVGRTLRDCAEAELAPDLLRQATEQARRRGLVTPAEIAEVEAALTAFGTLAP